MYSGTSFVLLLAVTRSVDETQAGIYSLTFSVAQLLLSIGRYGMRPFQATDIHEKYSFGEYLLSRVITCISMMLGAIIYGLLFGFEAYKFEVLFWICLLKMTDAIEDIFHGRQQQQDRLDVAGKLLTVRTLFTIALFALTIGWAKDILIASRITASSSLVFVLFINLLGVRQENKASLSLQGKRILSLLKECASLFVAMFLIQYIYNIPKIAIDAYLPIEIQTYYNILFMISFVISMCSEFLFRPLLLQVAREWDVNNAKRVLHTVLQMLAVMGVAGIILELFGAGIALKLLSCIYNIELEVYTVEFRVLLCGGIISAAVYFLYNVLTAIRGEKIILISYVSSAIVATVLPFVLVNKAGMLGACVAYVISMSFLLAGLFGGFLYRYLQKVKKKVAE